MDRIDEAVSVALDVQPFAENESAVRVWQMMQVEYGAENQSAAMRAALLAGMKVLFGPVVAWTTAKPTEPGAYWVKGYAYGRPSEKALVEVRLVGGELCSNLHAVNSDNDTDDFDALARHNDSFQWAGPLIYAPSLGEGDGR